MRGSLARLRARLAESPLAARLARGAFWTVLNTVVGRMLALVASIVIARVLGKAPFGQLGIVQGTVGMFGLLAGVGTSVTATKYVSELRVSDKLRAGRVIALSGWVALIGGALMTAGVLVAAPLLARRTLADPGMASHIRLSIGLLFFGALGGARSGALAGFEAWRAIAIVDSLSGLATIGLSVLGVYLGGLDGALLGAVSGSALACLGYEIALRRIAAEHGVPRVPLRDAFSEMKLVWHFSLPALLSAASAATVNWLCSAIVVNQTDGYANMGVFNAANQWRTAILFLPNTLGSALLPVLSSLVGAREGKRWGRVIWAGLLANGVLAGCAVGVVTLLSSRIMRSYGSGFASGQSTLIVLAIAAWLAALATIAGQTIISSGLMWWGVALNGSWAVVLLGATWWFRGDGALGFALANLIAYGSHVLTSLYFSWRVSKVVFARAEAPA
jgi:O-antigen/teichoic acid export membrane protein